MPVPTKKTYLPTPLGPPPRVVGVTRRHQPAQPSVPGPIPKSIDVLPDNVLEKILKKLEMLDLANFAKLSDRMNCLVRNFMNKIITSENIVWSNGELREVIKLDQEGHVNPVPHSGMTPEEMIATIAEAITDDPPLAVEQSYIIPY